jgi:hypothetical protein
MTISHRQPDDNQKAAAAGQSKKVARLACCCKLSDLLPLVQQLHQRPKTNGEKPAAAEAA